MQNQLIDQTFQMETESNEIMISQGFPREKEGGTFPMTWRNARSPIFPPSARHPCTMNPCFPAACLSVQHSVQPCWAVFAKAPPSERALYKTTDLKGALTLKITFKGHLWDLGNWILSLVNYTSEYEISKAVQQKHRLKSLWRSQFSFKIPNSLCSSL